MRSSEGLQDCNDKLIQDVLGAAIAVHRELGPGLTGVRV